MEKYIHGQHEELWLAMKSNFEFWLQQKNDSNLQDSWLKDYVLTLVLVIS